MIIYRYLLVQYLKVQLFCVASFIAILLTTRLKEIAQFAMMGASGWTIFRFACYQIPYIIPIAMPVSSLISAIVLVQRLSSSHELTALRASGKSLRSILSPLLLGGFLFGVLNFFVVSELATESHFLTRKLEHELKELNPLFLLQNKHLSKIKGVYINATGHSADKAEDLIIALWNKKNRMISLMTLKELLAIDAQLRGKEMTFLTSMESEVPDSFDNIIIENVQSSTTSSEEFSQLLKKNVWRFHNDYLKMPLLIVQMQKQRSELLEAQEGKDTFLIQKKQDNLNRSYSEISRRLSIAIAVFTFTLMGAAFGINVGRSHGQKGVYYVVSLAALCLICFFSAKRLDENFILATTLYLVPHLIIIILSIRVLYRISRGIE